MVLRGIQAGQLQAEPWGMGWLYAGLAATAEKHFKPFVPECFDHRSDCIVWLYICQTRDTMHAVRRQGAQGNSASRQGRGVCLVFSAPVYLLHF
jgi:hypothetical protein